ncbi:MAG: TetR/AcrR family transcriptional regulator [Pseudomonadota bacterium]
MDTGLSTKSAKRGRPARSEGEISDMRATIARHAMRLFQENGYEAVSMRRLAKEAGCTVMTLYRYYERKIDILRQLWAEIFDELFDELDAIAVAETDPDARLHAIAFAYVNFWLERREHYFLVFMSSDVSQSDVSVFVADDRSMARFSVFYESLASALDLPENDPAIALKTQQLLCALNGTAHNLITISAFPWAEPNDLVRAAVESVLKA